ncbi:hypothetical protein HY468_02350 [Candidatus Roizmanbacteria bacterium]|nr:hypothetical protein [Candidatus Roizmanbacteria bacterium]
MNNQFTPEQLNPSYYFYNIPHEMKEWVTACNYVWELIQKHEVLLKRLTDGQIAQDVQIHETATITGNVRIGSGTTIQSHVRIEGPVYIGENCRIDHAASIRPGTYLSNNSAIGHGTEIKNSVLFPFAKVSSLSFVGDSILGTHARVASGVMVSNRRFDQEEIVVKTPDQIYSTGLKHFGCVVGDHSRLGVNIVTNPATFIGAHTFVSGLLNLRGFIPADSFIELEQKTVILKNRYIAKLKSHGQ